MKRDCTVCLEDAGVDFDDADFSSEKFLKARKAHVCCECRGAILPGTVYHHYVGKNDGSLFTQKTCEPCQETRETFTCGRTYYFGELWGRMEQEAFPELTTASPCFTELTPATKAFVLDRWRAWKGLTSTSRPTPFTGGVR